MNNDRNINRIYKLDSKASKELFLLAFVII